MVLPGAQLFPHAPLPLYIFEPRYRAMLNWSLERDRMFCIAATKPGVSEARSADDFHHTVGLGLIRACVGRQDGTSNLILQGLARMQIVDFLQETPFRIAELHELPSKPAPRKAEEGLLADLLEASIAHFSPESTLMKSLEGQLEKIADPTVLSDVIAHTCLQDPEELNVTARIALLVEYLRAERQPPDENS